MGLIGRGAGKRLARVGETREISVDGQSVHLTVKRVKNINLRVGPGGRIALSAPPGVPDAHLVRFVREKRTWIERQQHRRRSAGDGQGMPREVSLEELAARRAALEQAVPMLIAKWEPLLGVKAGRLALRAMTSRWGSCNVKTGRICINIHLACFPPECLEYVVVHELCHLLERSHGPRFKALLDEFLPDWRRHRARLKAGALPGQG